MTQQKCFFFTLFYMQQLQQEKEEAWKAEQLNKSADIQSAQKELEEVKIILNSFSFSPLISIWSLNGSLLV